VHGGAPSKNLSGKRRPPCLVMPPRRPLLPAQIRARVRQSARASRATTRDSRLKPRLVILGVMNGAVFFLADRLRRRPPEAEISCVRLASLRGHPDVPVTCAAWRLSTMMRSRAARSCGDDILDTGRTLARLHRGWGSSVPRGENLRAAREAPASARLCCAPTGRVQDRDDSSSASDSITTGNTDAEAVRVRAG